MPTANNQIKFVPCVKSAYDNLLVKDDDTLYFITDEYKIYVGSHEYTKSLEVLQAEPTTSTAGTTGKLCWLRLLLLQNLISLIFCSNLRGASPRIRAVVNAEPARCEPPINQMTNY